MNRDTLLVCINFFTPLVCYEGCVNLSCSKKVSYIFENELLVTKINIVYM